MQGVLGAVIEKGEKVRIKQSGRVGVVAYKIEADAGANVWYNVVHLDSGGDNYYRANELEPITNGLRELIKALI